MVYLNWKDKDKMLSEIDTVPLLNFKYCAEESKNFDETNNLYIESDNLYALKYLEQKYTNKIKMIYIDPPYNTGKDFIYKDKFHKGRECRHSNWLNMIYPRLKIAHNLLKEDGVIFISIDDNEVHNLRKVCDEIFGEQNFVACICVKSRGGISNDKIISSNHNSLLFFAKNYSITNKNRDRFGIKKVEDDFKNYNKNDNDGNGFYALNPVTGPGGASKGNPYYEFLGVTNYWRFSEKTMNEMYKKNLIVKKNNTLYQKTYRKNTELKLKKISTWWDLNLFLTSNGTSQIKEIFNSKIIFDYSKPIELIKRMLEISTKDDDIILDFFSGSATTAHSVMKLNSEDGGNRKFILVQIPQPCDEKSEAFKNGYKNICEIGKERIRRAGEKIKEDFEKNNSQISIDENPKVLPDFGFKVLKSRGD